MRRLKLGPVIMCLLVLGLIGADYGQVAQAQTTSKKVQKAVTSKETKAQKKVEAKNTAAIQSKKVSASSKKKGKDRHVSKNGHKHHRITGHHKGLKKAHAARHGKAHALKVSSRIRPISDYQPPSPKPSDLWLAKDCPDIYRKMANEGQPKELTMKILESAYGCLGVPYRHGGTTPDGFDCSGFVKYVYQENGIKLGRSSRDQALDGKPVELSELKPGDLIFFKMHQRRKAASHIDHVGLYIGNGQFIHASNNPRAREIKVDNLENGHYTPRIVGARRILDNEGQMTSLMESY
jgi:hypothetical protein